jgi:hypothetical protein
MRPLAFCASAIGVGILLLVGFLVMARELFSESIFGAPDEPDGDADDTIPSRRVDPGAARSRHERAVLRP